MKRHVTGIFLIGALATSVLQAQLDRSVLPPAGPAPAVAFPEYDMVTTANGMRVIVVSDEKLPTVSMRLVIDRKPVREGDLRGVIDLAGELMRDGTTTRTKDQIDEQVDMMGGSLGSGGTFVYASGLSKHIADLMELMADITLHPSFPQDELDKLKTQTISVLKFRKTEPNAVASVVRKVGLFGRDHPYGEIETEETVGNITREKCLEIYKTFFKSNYAILAVVGDVRKDDAISLVNRYFGSWEKGTITEPACQSPRAPDRITVDLVDRPAAVQSVMSVSHTVQLKRTSPDVMPVSVMNTILGGGVFRLFNNLREKHAYTYGAYSSLDPDELIGSFVASSSVRTSVTDSALTQILYEINRIRDEKVGAQELQRAKNYLSGSFVRSLEIPDQIASYAIDMERYKLPHDYYKNYLKKVEAVTAEDVQRVARGYLSPADMLVTVVGSAKDIKEKLSAFGPVVMYDEDGNLITEKHAVTDSISPDRIFAQYIEKTGGRAKLASVKDRTMELTGTVQSMSLTVKTIQKAPDKFYQETGMMGMVQKMGVDGRKGWASSPRGVVDLSDEQLDALQVEATMDFYDRYTSLGYRAEVTGRKTINGMECYEVSLTKESVPPLKHYFGTSDFLKHREVTTMKTSQGPVDQVTDLLDYKDYQGYSVPSRIEQAAMGQTIVFTLVKFQVNTGVSDTLFAKPNQ